MPRKRYLDIPERLQQLDAALFNNRLDDLIAIFNTFKKEYPNHFNLRIFVDIGAWDNPDEFYLMGNRQETDEERDKRLAKARKVRNEKRRKKKEKEEKERAEYERLKTLYG